VATKRARQEAAKRNKGKAAAPTDATVTVGKK
jgi:hypothetical protein